MNAASLRPFDAAYRVAKRRGLGDGPALKDALRAVLRADAADRDRVADGFFDRYDGRAADLAAVVSAYNAAAGRAGR